MIQKYEGWMLAKSMIHHGCSEKTGSSPVLRTIFMYVGGQGEVPIPYINGNAIRGKLRRLLMREFFQFIGIDPAELDMKIYHTFFTGGALESAEDMYATIDLGMRKKIRELFIPLALLGCAIGNQMIPGKLKVGHAFPVCKEYAMFLPEWLQKDERASMPVRVFTDESFHTRKDDLHAEREKDEQATQMKVDYECFIPGTKFYHWWALEYATELEASCFGRLIEIFRESPIVGGMGSIGNGQVVFDYTPRIPSDKIYLEYVRRKKEDILKLLQELSNGKEK